MSPYEYRRGERRRISVEQGHPETSALTKPVRLPRLSGLMFDHVMKI